MEYPKAVKVTDENMYVCIRQYNGAWTTIKKGQTAVIIKNIKKDGYYLLFLGTSKITGKDEFETLYEPDLENYFKHIL